MRKKRGEFSGTVSFVWGNDRYLSVDVSGYYDEGRTNCANEDAYPPEGDLNVEKISLEHTRKNKKTVLRELNASLYETLTSNVEFMERVENSLDQIDRDD